MYGNEHLNFKNRHCACVASAPWTSQKVMFHLLTDWNSKKFFVNRKHPLNPCHPETYVVDCSYVSKLFPSKILTFNSRDRRYPIRTYPSESFSNFLLRFSYLLCSSLVNKNHYLLFLFIDYNYSFNKQESLLLTAGSNRNLDWDIRD